MPTTHEVPPEIGAERADIEADAAGSTLLTAYADTVAEAGDAEAHRWRDADGTWRTLTYRQVYDRVRDLSLGLAASGFRPGEFAAVWSGNRSEATVADYAVMHAGGVPVFIYNTVSAEQAAYIMGHCEATAAIVEAKYLEKVLSVRDQLPSLRQVILIDGEPADDSALADSGVVRLDDVLAAGAKEAERNPARFEATWRAVSPADLATLIYTSGTTGQPKAVMISHHNVRFYQKAIIRVLPEADEDESPRIISYLPMAHVTGRSVDHWTAMARPVSLTYCPEVTRIFEYAAQVHPTGLMGIPRVWEKLYAALGSNLPTLDPDTVASWPAEIRTAILERIGLDKVKTAVSGSAPLDPKIIRFFRALGVPMTEGWGMSELSNAATLARPDDARMGAVGRRFPGMEITIAADGEVLVRGPLVMGGYYKDPERTAESVDAEGWLHTGDVGELDAEGFLKITDRKKELIITSGGKNISPALIENHLQRHPLIGQACAIGDGRNYVTALLVLDPETAPGWAKEHGLPADVPLAELASHPAVLAEVSKGVDAANEHLARVIVERYAKEIDELYA